MNTYSIYRQIPGTTDGELLETGKTLEQATQIVKAELNSNPDSHLWPEIETDDAADILDAHQLQADEWEAEEYPARMTTKGDRGLIVWVKDAGRFGAYQPVVATFTADQAVTHSADECRAIRTAYTISALGGELNPHPIETIKPLPTRRVVAIGNETGITAVSPDYSAAVTNWLGGLEEQYAVDASIADDNRAMRGVM